ncbi:uncharacterized protein LOC107988171, partial [Cynoglossus semilaevis]|uniref:uncharacterized protein LOC107988171 n=1 Tax=Cynoglossus semilaevis TaxID=244447 RepID=UPI0007DC8435
MQCIVGRVYLDMALCGLEPRLNSICGIWKVLDAGLAFVDSMTSPLLRPVRAGLMSVKAIVSLMRLASKKACHPEELFSNVWTWNPPKELKSEQKRTDAFALLKKSKDQLRNPEDVNKTKELKKTRAVKAKTPGPTSSSTRGKGVVPMTPVTVRSKPFAQEPSCFDFNTAVPTLAFTPVQKVKATASSRKAPRTASKQQFHVYEDTRSPILPVPAAPRRIKKPIFKVGIRIYA